ncbi:MAG: hypothetical protein LBP59_17195 [Planctomycetaceae bacterium]|jgi:hypothetical protein|nr:hypothetical protein [Planctomycetaceae bacterium]
MDKNVICMKWGTKFSSRYVNILANMVRDNLRQPYRFICFTDDSTGIDSSVEIRPLPEMQLDKKLPERGWRKLTILGNQLGADIKGTGLFLDLDVLILDDIQPFFDCQGKFLIAQEWGFRDKIIGNSSVFRFEIGACQDILDNFLNNGEQIRKKYRNEQAYLSHAAHQKGILEFWDAKWCRSFKRHCLRAFPLCHFLPPLKPEGCKIIIFHGNPNPDEVINGWNARYGLRAAIPAKWINNIWKKYDKNT